MTREERFWGIEERGSGFEVEHMAFVLDLFLPKGVAEDTASLIRALLNCRDRLPASLVRTLPELIDRTEKELIRQEVDALVVREGCASLKLIALADGAEATWWPLLDRAMRAEVQMRAHALRMLSLRDSRDRRCYRRRRPGGGRPAWGQIEALCPRGVRHEHGKARHAAQPYARAAVRQLDRHCAGRQQGQPRTVALHLPVRRPHPSPRRRRATALRRYEAPNREDEDAERGEGSAHRDDRLRYAGRGTGRRQRECQRGHEPGVSERQRLQGGVLGACDVCRAQRQGRRPGIRGWSGQGAHIDSQFLVERECITVEKQRYLAKLTEGLGFERKAYVVGKDEDGDDETAVVAVITGEIKAKAKDGLLGPTVRAIITVLRGVKEPMTLAEIKEAMRMGEIADLREGTIKEAIRRSQLTERHIFKCHKTRGKANRYSLDDGADLLVLPEDD